MIQFSVTEDIAGQRLDVCIVQNEPNLSRAFVKKLCSEEKIAINGQRSAKPGQKVHAGDHIAIDYDIKQLDQIPDIDLPILYEDSDCLVINKPVGVLSHSKGAFNPEATVATFLRSKLKGLDGARGGIVHRLDRATSGVIICAKNPAALAWLQRQFAERKTKKVYYAIVSGKLDPEHAIIDMPIERNPKKPQTFRVGANGKTATTEYQIARTSGRFSLVKLLPQTGRTHQLRVHLQQLGHAILGDVLYGGEAADRLFLHAFSLEITLPNRQHKVFTAEMPPEFSSTLRRARV